MTASGTAALFRWFLITPISVSILKWTLVRYIWVLLKCLNELILNTSVDDVFSCPPWQTWHRVISLHGWVHIQISDRDIKPQISLTHFAARGTEYGILDQNSIIIDDGRIGLDSIVCMYNMILHMVWCHALRLSTVVRVNPPSKYEKYSKYFVQYHHLICWGFLNKSKYQ